MKTAVLSIQTMLFQWVAMVRPRGTEVEPEVRGHPRSQRKVYADQPHHAGLCSFSQSLSAALTRDCHPRPVARKAAMMLSSRRMETGDFRGAFWEPRTRGGIPGCASWIGFMPMRKDSVSGGDSTASQSCWEIFSGLRLFIVFPLAAVCPSQADQAN